MPARNARKIDEMTLPLPLLQEMSSHQIALAIWRSYISSHQKADRGRVHPAYVIVSALDIDETYKQDCFVMIKSLQIPRTIQEDIKSAFNSIVFETKMWIQHFLRVTFSRHLEEYWINHFDINWCVWLPNCKIDYVKTASNLLSAPELSLEQRFAVRSEFCMEEEIKKFPWQSLSDSFVTKVNPSVGFLMHYWLCYLKNELDQIALGDFNSIDAAMAAKTVTHHRFAYEYFWNRLGEDDQVSVVVNVFRNCNSLAWKSFSQMSLQQQNRVISEVPDKTLLNFWFRAKSPESAMRVWQQAKHLITPDQFREIVTDIFVFSKWDEDDMQLLLQIWHSASDEQMNNVVHEQDTDIIAQFFVSKNICKSGIEFFFEFLSLKNEHSRRQIMLENAGRFGSNVGDHDWANNKIIQLCFPTSDDQLRYKRSIMESEEMLNGCVELFNEGNLDDLVAKMKFYSTDTNMTLDFIDRLLKSEDAKKNQYFTEMEKWYKFSKFVDEIFSHVASAALNFEKWFITWYAQVCDSYWNDDSLDETEKILKMVFATDDELQIMKKHLFDSYRKLFFKYDFWEKFDEKYFIKFVMWCLNGDEKAYDELIKNLPVDDIFDRCFLEAEKSEWHTEWVLAGIDNFLRWYFKGVEGARAYKLRALNSIEKMVLRDSHLDVVLDWFFEEDKEGMLKFKTEKSQLWEK